MKNRTNTSGGSKDYFKNNKIWKIFMVYFIICLVILFSIFGVGAYFIKVENDNKFFNEYMLLNQKIQLNIISSIEQNVKNSIFISKIVGEAVGHGDSNISKFTKGMLENTFNNFLVESDENTFVEMWNIEGDSVVEANKYNRNKLNIEFDYLNNIENDDIYISNFMVDDLSEDIKTNIDVVSSVKNKYKNIVGYVHIRNDISYIIENMNVIDDDSIDVEILNEDGTFAYSEYDKDLALYDFNFKELYNEKLFKEILNEEIKYFKTDKGIYFVSFIKDSDFFKKNNMKIELKNSVIMLRVDYDIYESYMLFNEFFIILCSFMCVLISFVMSYILVSMKKEKDKINELTFKQASEDSLTGLYNRRFFYNTCNKLQTSNDNSLYSFIFIDLDKFKYINDTFGHEVGDCVLVETSQRLRKIVDENGVIARFGGDEFCIFLKSKSKEDINEFVENLINEIEKGIVVENNVHNISASIGVVIIKNGIIEIDEMIKMADNIMYKVKKSGGRNYEIHEEKF